MGKVARVGKAALASAWLIAACGPVVEIEPGAAAGQAGTDENSTKVKPSDGGRPDTTDGDAGAVSGGVATAGASGSATTSGAGGEPATSGGERNQPSLGGAPSAAGAPHDAGAPSQAGSAGSAANGEGGSAGSGDAPSAGAGGDDAPSAGAGGDDAGDETGSSPDTVLGLASGAYHQCILYGAGQVKCWGSNDYGQLGLGDTNARGDEPGEMGDQLPDVDLGTGHYAKSIAAGWYATCAILDDDSLKCWGLWAVAAPEADDNLGDEPAEMGDNLAPVALGTDRKVVQVSLGAEHVCAVLDDASLKCWGWNAWYQTGLPLNPDDDDETIGNDPGEMGDDLPALDFGPNHPVAQVAAGAMHTCAKLVSGEVKCFGYQNGLGNYGAGAYGVGPTLPSVSLGTGRSAKQLAAGYNHSCALLDDDSLKCWGNPVVGELGLGSGAHGYQGGWTDDMGDALPAVNLGSNLLPLQLQALGDQHTCALLDNRRLKCWGLNTLGRLGLGDEVPRGVSLDDMGDALPFLSFGRVSTVKLFSKGLHGCALLESGQLKCWGYNASGQLGLGDTITRGDEPGEMGRKLPAVRWW